MLEKSKKIHGKELVFNTILWVCLLFVFFQTGEQFCDTPRFVCFVAVDGQFYWVWLPKVETIVKPCLKER